MSLQSPEPEPLSAWEETDGATWDAFVETADHRAFPQLWSWGELRSEAGWQPIRLAVGPDRDRPRAGVQLLLRRIPLGGWSLAYAPRGPIGAMDDPLVRDALLVGLRALAADRRIGRMRADPETAAGDPYGAALLDPPVARGAEGPAADDPPHRPGTPEEDLRQSLARKHRQYVSKAGREGVTVEQLDRAGGSRHDGPRAGRLRSDLPLHRRARRVRGSDPGLLPAVVGRRSPGRTGLACSSRSATASGWPPCSTSSAATGWPRSTAG